MSTIVQAIMLKLLSPLLEKAKRAGVFLAFRIRLPDLLPTVSAGTETAADAEEVETMLLRGRLRAEAGRCPLDRVSAL